MADKWYYIQKISQLSPTGTLLVKLMDKYDKSNLATITKDEAREFYKEIIKHS